MTNWLSMLGCKNSPKVGTIEHILLSSQIEFLCCAFWKICDILLKIASLRPDAEVLQTLSVAEPSMYNIVAPLLYLCGSDISQFWCPISRGRPSADTCHISPASRDTISAQDLNPPDIRHRQFAASRAAPSSFLGSVHYCSALATELDGWSLSQCHILPAEAQHTSVIISLHSPVTHRCIIILSWLQQTFK